MTEDKRCENCRYYENVRVAWGDGFCRNPKVDMLEVEKKWFCKGWEAKR